MQQKIIDQGESAQKTYSEFAEWCSDRSRQLHSDIKAGQSEVTNLQAVVEEQADTISATDTKIGELSAALSTLQADLKAMRAIRDKEAADFLVQEKDLTDTTDMLQRSIAILEREFNGKASLLQSSSSVHQLVDALTAMVEASSVTSADAEALTALIQNGAGISSEEAEQDRALDEAADAAFGTQGQDPEGHGSIIDTLHTLLDKSEGELVEVRKNEANRKHTFDLLSFDMEQKLQLMQKEMNRAKHVKAQAGQKKASAEGEMSVAKQGLSEDKKSLAELHHQCMSRASEFREETKDRGEELSALAKAKEVVQEMTGAAAKQTYEGGGAAAAASFLQVAEQSETPEVQAVRRVRQLAKQLGAPILAQLSSKMEVTLRAATISGEDPFAKVKGLISDMLVKLEEQARSESQEKAYCDKELMDTTNKKEDKDDQIDDLTTKVDRLMAESASLAEQTAHLQQELAELAQTQADLNRLRAEEKQVFLKSKPEMEQGIAGVQMALQVLRDYYAKSSSSSGADSGAGAGIIGILEVAESDFSKGLAELVSEEEASEKAYEETTKENEIMKTMKEQDVKYKGKKSKEVAKAASEYASDRDGAQNELDAVNEYLEKLKAQCIAKPDSYEERKKRRDKMVAGLKEALQLLDSPGAASFVQERSVIQRRRLRHTAPR